MLYSRAKEIGEICGLNTPAEFINNISLHCLNLFTYSEMQQELEELRADAKANGVRFSNLCHDAIDEGDSEDEPCYFCKKLIDLAKEV